MIEKDRVGITSNTIRVTTIRAVMKNVLVDKSAWDKWRYKSYTRSVFYLKNQAIWERDEIIYQLALDQAFNSEAGLKAVLMGDYGISDYDKIFEAIFFRVMAYNKWHKAQGLKKPVVNKVNHNGHAAKKV